MRPKPRIKPVAVEAICARCARPFVYVRRGRRRTRCSDCTVQSVRDRSAAWREEARSEIEAMPAAYPPMLRRAIVAASRAMDRTFKHVDNLPQAHRDEILGLILLGSIRRLSIEAIDKDSPGPLTGSIDGLPR